MIATARHQLADAFSIFTGKHDTVKPATAAVPVHSIFRCANNQCGNVGTTLLTHASGALLSFAQFAGCAMV
jgi:hypothetical protein